eukprot:5033367-Karenia_brevis.AAC.1
MDHKPSESIATAGHAPQASLKDFSSQQTALNCHETPCGPSPSMSSKACKDFNSQDLPTSVSEGLSATADHAAPPALFEGVIAEVANNSEDVAASPLLFDAQHRVMTKRFATAGHASPGLASKDSNSQIREQFGACATAGHAPSMPVLSDANALPSNLKDFNSRTSESCMSVKDFDSQEHGHCVRSATAGHATQASLSSKACKDS